MFPCEVLTNLFLVSFSGDWNRKTQKNDSTLSENNNIVAGISLEIYLAHLPHHLLALRVLSVST